MNFTDWRSSWLLWNHVSVGEAIAITRHVNLTLCPSYANALVGLITNLGAACRRSTKKWFYVRRKLWRKIILFPGTTIPYRSRNRRSCICQSTISWAKNIRLIDQWEEHIYPNSHTWLVACLWSSDIDCSRSVSCDYCDRPLTMDEEDIRGQSCAF